MTKDAQNFISKKISQLIHEGYEISQAIAIAYSEARDRGFHIPDYEKENPITQDQLNIFIGQLNLGFGHFFILKALMNARTMNASKIIEELTKYELKSATIFSRLKDLNLVGAIKADQKLGYSITADGKELYELMLEKINKNKSYEKENPTSFIEKAALKKVRDVALEISKKYKKIEFTNVSLEDGINPETNKEEKFIRITGRHLGANDFSLSQFGLDEVLQTPFEDLFILYSSEILEELKTKMQTVDINSPEFLDLIDSVISKVEALYNRSTMLNNFSKGDEYIRSKLDREHKVNLSNKDIPIVAVRIAENFIEVRGVAPENQLNQFDMNQEFVFLKDRNNNQYKILEFPKPYKDMPEQYEMPIEFFVYLIFFECIEAFRQRPDLFHLKISE